MVNINTNLSSLIVQNNLKKSTFSLNQAIERMTTGFKINHASDNAANYSISQNMSSKLSSYEVAQDNVSMGMDLISTAAGSLDLISTHLQRIRDLAEQAANGTYGAQSLQAIQSEVDARIAEIIRVAANTEYNGIQLLSSSPTEILKPNSNGFLKNIQERDTSTMITLKEVFNNPELIDQAEPGDAFAINDMEDFNIFVENVGDFEGFEVVFGTDIDMSAADTDSSSPLISSLNNFVVDGNGHTISNMDGGLFFIVENSTIKNLGLVNTNITNNCSPLAFAADNSAISNCYADGGSITGYSYFFGGLVGSMTGTMEYCWSDIDINAEATVGIGGLVATCYGSSLDTAGVLDISNSFAKGDVRNNYDSDLAVAGGLVGGLMGSVTNCYASGEVSSASGNSAGLCYSPNALVGSLGAELLTVSNSLYTGTSDVPVVQGEYTDKSAVRELSFQVGVNGDTNSRILLEAGFSIGLSVDVSSNESAVAALAVIDDCINQVSEKQTQYGSAYNRLESALDSIGVSIDNLTSSRSTLRDADIAQESSQYIKNQILQQAAATLLATANQAPSIALQLM